jgi:hypothetical protein
MESSNAALRAKNDAAAARELRELREDTLKGLEYALVTFGGNLNEADRTILIDAKEVLQEVWPA